MDARKFSHNNVFAWIFAVAVVLFIAECYWCAASAPQALVSEAPRASAPHPDAPVLRPMVEAEIRLDGRQPFMPWREMVIVPVTPLVADVDIKAPPLLEPVNVSERVSKLTRIDTDTPLRLFGVAEARGRRVCLIQTGSGERCSLDPGARIPGTEATVARIDKQSVQIVENDRRWQVTNASDRSERENSGGEVRLK